MHGALVSSKASIQSTDSLLLCPEVDPWVIGGASGAESGLKSVRMVLEATMDEAQR